MNVNTSAALFDELEKIAGVGSFIGKGFSQIGKHLAGNAAPMSKGIGRVWSAGTANAAAKGTNKTLGGLGALAKSRYGQMAAAAGVPAAAGYGIAKTIGN